MRCGPGGRKGAEGAAERTLIGGGQTQAPETGQSPEIPACESHGHGHPEGAGIAATGAQGLCAPNNAGLGIRDAWTHA